MKLFHLKRTCDACPSQWEAINEESQPVYIRFRFDSLTVHCPYDSESESYEAFMGTQILAMSHIHGKGEEFRGTMCTGEMLALTSYTRGEVAV